jgi:hypothetical protein
MGDDAHDPSLDGRVRALEDIIDGLDAEQRRTRERLADVARLAEIMTPPQSPSPRHAAPKRDRHGLKVIPGGLAALVPLAMPGHGGAGLVPVAGQVWLSARNWPRWAVAAVALGLAGVMAAPTAADVRDAPARPAPAADCHAPRSWHPNRPDSDRDDKDVVARLPLAGCPAAGEGGAQPLTWHPVSVRRGVHRLPRGGEMGP